MDEQHVRALAERAKELECMYAVEEALNNRALTLPEMMKQLTAIIPAGFSWPDACRVSITLWSDVYQTEDYQGVDIAYRAPIQIEDVTIGEIASGYRTALLTEECRLLQYEKKLTDTIAGRISQLALSRQREMALLMNMLRQIDPDMLIGVSEKLRVYLSHAVGAPAEDLIRDLGAYGGASYGEVNAPMAAGRFLNAEQMIQRLVEGSAAFLSQDTLFTLLGEWIHQQRILAFVKTVDRKDSRIGDILDAVRKYAGAVAAGEQQDSPTERWLISELTHRFLSDDERLINLVLDNLRIQDFAPMIERIIGSERSMGNIGGKGAGLFIAWQILRHAAKEDPLLKDIHVPKTWYIATDQIVDFLHYNNLEELNCYKYNSPFYLRMTYDTVVAKIKNASLPPQTVNMLHLVLEEMGDTPLIVRSSSLLEDKHSGTFSGKYKSLFLPNTGSRSQRLDALADAVLEVYSSMYNPDSLQYRRERGLINFTEQMGVLIQEVVGRKIGPYFMPMYAGVAFSHSLLRWSPRIQREDGLVRLVMGLGTRAVDRVNDDYPIMFAPGKPGLRINQTPFDIRHYAPKRIDVIHQEQGFITVDADAFLREMGGEIPQLHQYVSVYQQDFIVNKNAYSLNPKKDEMIVTLHHPLSASPLAKTIKRLLEVLSDTLECPVDIEFAHDGQRLYLLQCRPQGSGMMSAPAPIPQNIPWQDLLFSANRYISDGLLRDIAYIVYVDPDAYNALPSKEALLAVGEAVGRLNDALPRQKFILMGPGRWGSRGDIKLGVRVTYSDLSNTAALIEIAKEKHAYVPELSFGTHFFQDLVEANIVYIPLYPGQDGVAFQDGFFHGSENILGKILPEYAWLSDVVKVIDVPVSSFGRTLSIHMNSELNQAVAFFTKQQEGAQAQNAPRPSGSAAWRNWRLETQQEHWQWRYYMAQNVANAMDMEAAGVKGVYLFGSVNTGGTGIGSDIDLILHVESRAAEALAPLRQWLDGWSRALARINFLQTGSDAEGLLDAHFVTDEDIAAGDSYAIKLTSTIDPALPLRVR